MNHIRNKPTAKGMWDALKQHHEKSTLSNKVILMRRICNARMGEDGDMEQHIDEMTGLFQRLIALGETQLSDSWTVAMILSSLPASYSTLTTALETRPEADLTLSLVQSKLIGEYRQRKANEGTSDSDSVMKVNSEQSRCYFCDDFGHFKSSCPHYIEWKKKKNVKPAETASQAEYEQQSSRSQRNEEYLFIVSTVTEGYNRNDWVLDSAATSHASGDSNKCSTMQHGAYGIAIMANNSSLNILGKGTVVVNTINDNGNVNSTTLHDVLFIPGIGPNLLSIRKLTVDGFSVNFFKDSCQIIRGNHQIGVAYNESQIYMLQSHDSAIVNNCGVVLENNYL